MGTLSSFILFCVIYLAVVLLAVALLMYIDNERCPRCKSKWTTTPIINDACRNVDIVTWKCHYCSTIWDVDYRMGNRCCDDDSVCLVCSGKYIVEQESNDKSNTHKQS